MAGDAASTGWELGGAAPAVGSSASSVTAGLGVPDLGGGGGGAVLELDGALPDGALPSGIEVVHEGAFAEEVFAESGGHSCSP